MQKTGLVLNPSIHQWLNACSNAAASKLSTISLGLEFVQGLLHISLVVGTVSSYINFHTSGEFKVIVQVLRGVSGA